jgi:dephospho-CoA kinase
MAVRGHRHDLSGARSGAAHMLLIGLTGSIATGKSTVSLILRSPPYQLPVIDADILARRVVEPGTPSYKKIVAHFSPTVPDLLLPLPEQEPAAGVAGRRGQPLNRLALGRRVFGDDPERRRDRAVLNGIVHPAVRREMYKEILYYFFRGHWAVVLDVPLLFESGLDMICGTIMVVAVSDPTIQMHRLRVRNPQLSVEDAEHRVQSQGNVREKARQAEARGVGAGVVVWNDGTMQQLEEEVGVVMKMLKERNPQWWAWLLLLVPPLTGMLVLWNLFRAWRSRRKWESERKLEKARQ